jgi:lantibiotic leader peptide-processing serine protease
VPRTRRVLACLVTSGTLIAGLLIGGAAVAAAGETQTYLVLYRDLAIPADASSTIGSAGGQLVKAYDAIGVAVARSDSASFRTTLLADARIGAVASTTNSATRISPEETAAADAAAVDIPATDSDNLSGLQWDMVQIHTPEAHAITGGNSSVLVGDLDTGLDFTHPDIAPNYDAANSTDCSSGAPTPLLPGNDKAGHGTHTAGTIVAASNGTGIVGVAPNVKIAGIKASNDDGFFFPEMVVCAFMWAGSHGVDVTNNSYFADPWLFNCKNDPEQRAIFAAEQRAIKYAQSKGTVVVASEGNQSDDLAHPTMDETSPDFPPDSAFDREITNACEVVPVEVPGVIGVTANGNLGYKSYYSSYGMGTADVVAPGGDRRFQLTPAAPNGRVLSTWPSTVACPAALTVVDPTTGAKYCYLQGTSMAGPHVAGVAALILSQHPTWKTGAVTGKLFVTADEIACPASYTTPVDYTAFPALDGGAPQVCTGGIGYNSFNGHGQVNALSAVQ